MSHIHLPDGILPVWLWISGYIVIFLYIAFSAKYYNKVNNSSKIAIVGVMSALMLIAMSIEIIPPAYHLNLAVLSGIILGPFLSILSIFIVNIFLSLLGHGGFTVIGLNTILVGMEAILGYFGFKFFFSKIKKVFLSIFLATFLALFVSCIGTVGVVYLGTHNTEEIFHKHEHNHEHVEKNQNNHEHEEHGDFDIGKFIALVFSFGILGWTIESAFTAFMANYINQIKPDIIKCTESQALSKVE